MPAHLWTVTLRFLGGDVPGLPYLTRSIHGSEHLFSRPCPQFCGHQSAILVSSNFTHLIHSTTLGNNNDRKASSAAAGTAVSHALVTVVSGGNCFHLRASA